MITTQYIAGFTDADGSISFHSIGGIASRKKEGWAAAICLVNTNIEVLEKIKEFVGAGKIYYQLGKRENHSTTGRLLFTNQKDVIKFLSKIEKNLIIKKKQAELMLEYCKSRQKRCPRRGQHIPYSKREKECVSGVKNANIKNSFRAKGFRVIPFS